MVAFVRSILLVWVLAAPMIGCTSAPSETTAQAIIIVDNQPFAMKPGTQVTLSDSSRLHYVGVQSDSRCQPGHQCVWAGNAVVGFKWEPASASAQTFQLGTPEPPQWRDLGNLRLTLLSLAFGAAPKVQLRIEHAQ